VASLTKNRRPGDPELIEAAQALKAVRLEEVLSKALMEAPRLDQTQVKRLAALLGEGA
jgi:hypothetical protein